MTPPLNELPSESAELRLYECFANRGWAARVAAGRPYRNLPELFAAAETAWAGLAAEGWLAAFSAHPRIGESGGHAPGHSEREQIRVAQAHGATLAALAAENHRYEERFGHVFLIAAQGRGADEILDELRRRMSHDPATELRIASDEQRKISRMRLERLLET